MESSKQHLHYQASGQSKSIKAATGVLASLFLLSALLPYYSLLLPAAYNLINVFCINMNKNYMFLLFNGILVILKIFTSAGDSNDGSGVHGMSNVRHEVRSKEKEDEPSSEVEEVKLEEQVEEEEVHCREEELALVVVGGESGICITEQVEGDQQGNGIRNADEDEEDAIGSLSTEELNKKFDDFIRKIREGIKTEAEQARLALCWQVE